MFRRFDGTFGGEPVDFHHLDYIRICLDSQDALSTPEDRNAILDTPAGPERDAILDAGYEANMVAWPERHAFRLSAAFQDAPEHGWERFLWLCAYHNETAAAYTADPRAVCRF
ncbi:hypothetical protein [Luteibacter sp. 9133]|uniref:hypothetical protein n=1 Tax=Luteibacter sp. 9133 TaxID=1500891 RepID=UPI0005B801CB|nr:hypothetical protein [Luteibacter sp. 9133]